MRGRQNKLGHGTGTRGFHRVSKTEAQAIVAAIRARVAARRESK